MKKLFIGIILGALLATAVPAAAEEINKRITATVRADYTVELDGKKVELNNHPLAYDGSSYLPVREVANLLGKDVDFKDGVIKLNTPKAEVIETTYKELRAIEIDGVAYFSAMDYSNKWLPYQWAFDSSKNEMYLTDTDTTYLTVSLDESESTYSYKGTYINVKYYKDPADLKPAE